MSTQTIQNMVDATGGGDSDGMRKAAILVSALERDAVDALLELIGPAQAGLVRQAVIELDRIDPDEQEQIVREFLHLGSPHSGDRHAEQLDAKSAARHCGRDNRGMGINSDNRKVQNPPAAAGFGFLEETTAEDLVGILAVERPQTIALVLSRMPPARAGNVLVRFSPDVQAEVVRRLVDLEETDAEILREVELELQRRLSQKLHTERRRVAGVPAVADIIEASSRRIGTEILRNLEARDQRLAQRLETAEDDKDNGPAAGAPAADGDDSHRARPPQPPRFEFTDLAAMDDDALRTITENINAEIMVLALLGTPGDLSERLLRQMPRRRAAVVRRQIKAIGPVRLDDVEQARQMLLKTAASLHAQGRNCTQAKPSTAGATLGKAA